jgi:hypothetical protein
LDIHTESVLHLFRRMQLLLCSAKQAGRDDKWKVQIAVRSEHHAHPVQENWILSSSQLRSPRPSSWHVGCRSHGARGCFTFSMICAVDEEIHERWQCPFLCRHVQKRTTVALMSSSPCPFGENHLLLPAVIGLVGRFTETQMQWA